MVNVVLHNSSQRECRGGGERCVFSETVDKCCIEEVELYDLVEFGLVYQWSECMEE